MAVDSPKDLSRRDLIRTLAAGSAAVAATSASPAIIRSEASRGRAVTVFRLRTRNTRTCRACKLHHRYNIYISFARADRDRPHPGCNCPVTKQKLPKEDFARLFLDTGAIRAGSVDLRHVPPSEGSGRGRRRRTGAMRRAG